MATSCPDRVTSVPELVVNGAFIAGLAAAVPISVWFYLRERRHFPIMQRKPFLSVICVIMISVSAIIATLTSLLAPLFSCTLMFLSTSGICLVAVTSFIVRFALITLDYEAAQTIVSRMGAIQRRSVGISQLFIVRLRNFFVSHKTVFGACLILSFVIWSPAFIVLSGVPVSARFLSDQCLPAVQNFFYYSMFAGSLIMVLFLILAVRLRKVKDNFFIREELKDMAYVALWFLVTYGAGIMIKPIRIASTCNFRFITIVSFLLPCYGFLYVCMYKPYRRYIMHKKEHNSLQLHIKKTVSKSASSEVPTFSSEGMVTVLRDAKMRAFYAEFLVKEFATENLLFWMEASRLLESEGERKELIEQVRHVYSTFCTDDGIYNVNISSRARETIQSIVLTQLEDDKLTDAEIRQTFVQAQQEIERLMLHDPFRRFCESPEYKNMCAEFGAPRL